MSSKFRKDSDKRNYTVRTFLRRFLSFGLICLLLIACIATLVAFYIMIQYQVEQSIELGYMKNLSIRSATMAALKQNDLEMIGSDLSSSAHIISDLVSPASGAVNEAFMTKANIENLTHDGPSLARVESKECLTSDGQTSYKFKFSGNIFQNGVEVADWTDAEKENYEENKEWLRANCEFVKIDGKPIFPVIETDGRPEVVQLRYQDAPEETVWDESSWYLAPEPQTSPNWQKALKDDNFKQKFEESKQLCAAAVPFFGTSLHTNYAKTISSGSFIGLADSGMFCNSPFAINFFYDEAISDPDYSCPAGDIPLKYPNWDSKWFSPVCRTWFQEQKENPNRNTLSDLYLYAGGDIYGLTPCAPITQKISEKKSEFHGALCLDLDPSGPLIDYFPFNENEKPQYLLFDGDEEFDSITEIDESSYKSFIKQIIGKSLIQQEGGDSLTIDLLVAWSKRARIYDNKHVTWGNVKFTIASSARQEKNSYSYWFTVDDVKINFRNTFGGDDAKRGYSDLDHGQDKVVDKKVMKLAFFIEGSKIAEKIQNLKEMLVKDVFYQVSMVILLASVLMIIIGVMRVKRLAIKMTAQIIHLYETLYQIASDRTRKGAVELSFKHTSKELNELHLTFNKVARTINLASLTMKDTIEDEHALAQSLLGYADAYHIYHEYDTEHSQKGVCMANIGSIMMQMGDYKKARQYYSDAISNGNKQIVGFGAKDLEQGDSKQQQIHAKDLGMNKFVLALRLFQRGQAVLATVKRDYPLRELLEDACFSDEMNSKFSKDNLLTKSMEFSKFENLTKASQQENYDRRQILEIIKEGKEDYLSALNNLDLSPEANEDMERSMLDIAIYLSHHFLELSLYERIIDGKSRNIGYKEAEGVIEDNNWKSVIKDDTVLAYLGQIEKLGDLQSWYPKKKELLSTDFANRARRGLLVTSYEYCCQYMEFCKGLYLHQSGWVDKALVCYTASLEKGGSYSNNMMRLECLESIELIIKQKAEMERKKIARMNTRQRNSVRSKQTLEVVGWRSCKAIYRFLSHHYIQRRSVVFIVDTEYDSVVCRDIAMEHVTKFFGALNEEDHFGYISLSNTSKDDMILEKVTRNQKMKKTMLKEISKRDIEYVMGNFNDQSSKTIRLERALEKAYEWQNTMAPDYEKEINGRTYVGPHKWIVCLLGDDVYAVNQFNLKHKEKLSRQQNMSISIMALSVEQKTNHAKHYREICHLSQEGIYCNIVYQSDSRQAEKERERADSVVERFFSNIQVYSTEKKTVIREFFNNL